jgi:hypothetical protein
LDLVSRFYSLKYKNYSETNFCFQTLGCIILIRPLQKIYVAAPLMAKVLLSDTAPANSRAEFQTIRVGKLCKAYKNSEIQQKRK